MIGLASPGVEMSFEMRFQSLEVESEDVVCGPTPTATFVRSALEPGPGCGGTPLHLCVSCYFRYKPTSNKIASFAATLLERLNKQPFRPSHFFIP